MLEEEVVVVVGDPVNRLRATEGEDAGEDLLREGRVGEGDAGSPFEPVDSFPPVNSFTSLSALSSGTSSLGISRDLRESPVFDKLFPLDLASDEDEISLDFLLTLGLWLSAELS